MSVLRWSRRIYKIPDAKPENTFAFSGEAKNKKYATEIIHECHEAWRRLIHGEAPAKTSSYDISMYVLCYLLMLHVPYLFPNFTAATLPFTIPPVLLGGMIRLTPACL